MPWRLRWPDRTRSLPHRGGQACLRPGATQPHNRTAAPSEVTNLCLLFFFPMLGRGQKGDASISPAEKLVRCVWWLTPVILALRAEAGGSLQVPGQLSPHWETPSNKASPNQTKPSQKTRAGVTRPSLICYSGVKAHSSLIPSSADPAPRAPPSSSAPLFLSLLWILLLFLAFLTHTLLS